MSAFDPLQTFAAQIILSVRENCGRTQIAIAIAFVALLSICSVWADKRFRHQDRLPMQWSFAGSVNWTAPRRIALAFTPTLAALMPGGTAVLVLVSGEPRPGQGALVRRLFFWWA
jgi:hypothetical protein